MYEYDSFKERNSNYVRTVGLKYGCEAPELVCESKANDRVDVFSFGCVLNEIFTRVPSYSDLFDIDHMNVHTVIVHFRFQS